MTHIEERTAFERGYLAAQYLLGARGSVLGSGCDPATPVGSRLLQALRHEDRAVRAQNLAATLARWVNELEGRKA